MSKNKARIDESILGAYQQWTIERRQPQPNIRLGTTFRDDLLRETQARVDQLIDEMMRLNVRVRRR